MSFDIEGYLKQKADTAGVRLVAPSLQPNFDGRVFVLAPRDRAGPGSGLSLSGLEIMQNPSDEAIVSLCDARFEQSLSALQKYLVTNGR